MAVHHWPHQLANQVVRLWCDNQTAVQIINKLTFRSFMVMPLGRAFVLRHNVLFVAIHVLGVYNSIADTFSHFQK